MLSPLCKSCVSRYLPAAPKTFRQPRPQPRRRHLILYRMHVVSVLTHVEEHLLVSGRLVQRRDSRRRARAPASTADQLEAGRRLDNHAPGPTVGLGVNGSLGVNRIGLHWSRCPIPIERRVERLRLQTGLHVLPRQRRRRSCLISS